MRNFRVLSIVDLYVLTLMAALTGCSSTQTSSPSASALPSSALPALGRDEIRLTFLGTGSPRPSIQRSGPAILVEAGSHRFLVDAGPGAVGQMLRSVGWEPLVNIDLALITHLHFDHTEEIPNLFLTGWLYGRKTPFTLYGPKGTEAMAAAFESAYTWDIGMRGLSGVPLTAGHIVAHDITPGVIINQGGLVVTAFHVAHMPVNPKTYVPYSYWGDTLGYRIDYKGHSVVFSGDTRTLLDSAIAQESVGVDVLIHEVQIPTLGDSAEAQRANLSLCVHSSPEEAGKLFAQTKPSLAVYSHIIPPETTGQQLAELTRPFYSGDLITAEDFMTITIGDKVTIGESRGFGIQSFTDLNGATK